MSKCELCKSSARVYCESDEARLCWSCDAKVHSANFLVARHVRNLLCHSCQSPTAWNGSGEKLGRTISLCERCVVAGCVKFAEKVEREGERDVSSESGTDFDSSEEDDDENIVDKKVLDSCNQVVPLASSTSLLPPVSSSSSEDRSRIDMNVSLKRSPDFAVDLNSKDDVDSSCIAGEENSHSSSLRPFKFRKLEVNETGRPQGTSTGLRISERARRIRRLGDVTESIRGVGAYECVEFDLNECPFDQHE
ncbi:hypothetical protein ACET3Z_009879 [Daucus carota]